MKRCLLSLAVMAALSGCSLIPDYQRPAAPVPSAWETGDQASASGTVLIGWQSFFKDPELQRLIAVALENNRDLRVAALTVEANRALYGIQRAEVYPQLDLNGNGSRMRMPADLSNSGESSITSQYSATVGVSWELDLFGRIASLREQALQEFLASDEARRGVQISLVANVASTYFTWQADQALLEVTRETLDTYEESLALTNRSFEVGVASSLELSQARTAVETARVRLAQYRRFVAQDRNALTALLGQAAPQLPAQSASLNQQLLAELPVGLPSEVLYQRPDILQAEYQLRAVNASIGAAKAAFFPSISLTGAGGTASSDLDGLFGSGSEYWSFTPSISVPIFRAGALKASLDYAEIIKNQQVAQYEGAIQTAFQEVADGLVARETYIEQVNAQRALLETSEDYYRLADRRYRTGIDSYLTVLDAQRQLFEARQGAVTDRLSQLISEVNLYKALGGGWYEAQPPEVREPEA
ncbi:MAG: efflux transporter outer membrane subunit [Halopseudomonas sp.]|uniref:efflux transporter outer membrane subunit n=1 Tax=Halopseudomonas sp. TaxID=2901191 RepID=UPI003002F974